jgi:molybdate transport system substrate-binding protein
VVPGAYAEGLTGQLAYNARMSNASLPCLVLLLCLAVAGGARADAPLRAAVAANFRAAAEALAEEWQRNGGPPVVISSAATGVLAAQWRHGAPFDLLLAADSERPAALAADGFSTGAPRCYAVGSLVLLGAGKDGLAAALANPELSIAIGNPRSAPYGAAAMAVLGRPEFADQGPRRILHGASVLQAFQFFASGAADLALVARSLSPREGIAVPDSWHPPIEQHAIIHRDSAQTAQAMAFLDFITGSGARDTLSALGYRPCP